MQKHAVFSRGNSVLHIRAPRRGSTLSSVAVHFQPTEIDTVRPTPSLRTLEDLPVERGLPFLGRALDGLKAEFDFDTIFQEHGDCEHMLLNLGPGGGYSLFLRRAEDMYETSVTKAKQTRIKWPEGVENLIMPMGHSPTNAEVKPWRGALGKVLSQGMIMRLQLPLIVEQFSEAIHKHTQSGEEVQWWTASRRLTFSAALRAALGDLFTREEEEYLFPYACDMGQAVFNTNFGLKEGLPYTPYRRGVEARKVMIEFLTQKLQNLLEDREALMKGDSVVRGVLKGLEEEGIDTSNRSGSDIVARLAMEVVFLMFAGTDTTSFTISKTMTYLAKHPEWMQALMDEQDRLRAEFGDILDRKVISRSSVAVAISQEALRLRPPSKVLFREATEDMTIADIAVPKGTTIAMSVRKVILSSGNGRDEFDPQQWLSEDHTQVTRNTTDAGNFSFGKGPRNCPGQSLAEIELVTALAILGREAESINMSQEEIDREIFIVGDHPTGLPLTLVPRSQQRCMRTTA